MKKRINIVVPLLIALVIIFAIPPIYFFYIMSYPGQGVNDIRNDFDANEESLTEVVDYCKSTWIDDFRIRKTYADLNNSYLLVYANGEECPLESYEDLNPVKSAIEQLFNKNYGPIDKDGNIILFQRWANKDVGKGVVYSIDGSVPTEEDIQFLTLIEPLEEAGWYYYEDDFNEWKLRRQEEKKLVVNGN